MLFPTWSPARQQILFAADLLGMIHALALQTPGYHARRTPRRKSEELIRTARAGTTREVDDVEAQRRAMLSHDVSRRFDGSMEKAASAVHARAVNAVGLDDHMVTPEPAMRFAALLRAESLGLSVDCGHLAAFYDPETFAKTVGAFLR